MRAFLIGVLFLGWAVVPARAVSPQSDFLSTFTKLDDARRLQRTGDLATALLEYQECELELKKLRALYPKWEPDLLAARLTDCRAQIAVLSGNPAPDSAAPDSGAASSDNNGAPTSAGPSADTGAATGTLEQRYLAVYLGINDAERLEQNGEFSDAVAGFKNCYEQLQEIHAADPEWESVLMASRMEDCRSKINELGQKIGDANAISAYPPLTKKESATQYPWKTDILTTVFYIGGKTTPADGWSSHLVDRYGGADNWQDMSGYASSRHASLMNPFYVALPFNDLADPDKAKQWIPPTWNKPSRDGKPVSACQGRWVEIKASNGRDCFAQWEDVGPGGTDDAEYVFGTAQPAAGKSSGMAVSPAVAKFLGIVPTGSALTDWRFVDDADVQPGLWLKYDEQAIIFRALRQRQEEEKPAQASEPEPAPVAKSKSSTESAPAPVSIAETKAEPASEPAKKKSAPEKESKPATSTGDIP